jgi:hypothetical protein
LTHESANACYDAALHAAFETDLPVDQAVAALQISAATTRANAAAPAAQPASTRLGRLMRDPASDASARNSAAAAGVYTPEQVAARVSGGGRI